LREEKTPQGTGPSSALSVARRKQDPQGCSALHSTHGPNYGRGKRRKWDSRRLQRRCTAPPPAAIIAEMTASGIGRRYDGNPRYSSPRPGSNEEGQYCATRHSPGKEVLRRSKRRRFGAKRSAAVQPTAFRQCRSCRPFPHTPERARAHRDGHALPRKQRHTRPRPARKPPPKAHSR